MPYHEGRRPAHLERADYMIGSNLGRTIQACRQAVQEARLAADWLRHQGYQTVGLIGTSIGSCIAFLTFAHDDRFKVGVFNHASSYFADVVWQGLTTQHVRQSLESHISLDDLRYYWSLISPQTFVHRLQGTTRRSLMISARYDLSFPPHLTRLFYQELARWNVPFDTATLPCGHYTTAVTPFKYMDGFLIANYFRKHL
jgi:pimeloyl-ACP methyl ester carboxylesterase